MTTLPLKIPEWATQIPGRRKEFKLHTSPGHAKNAITCSEGVGTIYELVDGEWVERFSNSVRDSNSEPKACEVCNKATVEMVYPHYSQPYSRNEGAFVWKGFTRVFKCIDCRK